MKWFKIFESKEIAYTYFKNTSSILIRIKGKNICLSLFNNELIATADACPHMSESLSNGKINYIGELICPLHEYRFDLKTGRECEGRTKDLEIYEVKSSNDGIFIGLNL